MRKKGLLKTTALLLCGTLLLTTTKPVDACTALYAGSKTTKNGSTYVGRCEDFGPDYIKYFKIIPAKDHEDNELFQDSYGLSIPYPSHTLRYSVVCDDESEYDYGTEIPFGEAGINECGVSVSATVSTYMNKKAHEADRLTIGGITELSMTSLILQQAVRARQGVELLAELIDNYGHGNSEIGNPDYNEVSTVLISDPYETWVMEIVSGHQYIATRLDNNKVSVIPNVMMTGQVNVTSDNTIASKGLISTAKKGGFYVTDKIGDNEINVAKSYSEGYDAYESYRAYYGTYFFNPKLANNMDVVPQDASKHADTYPNVSTEDNTTAAGPFSLQFKPSSKVNGSIDLSFLREIWKSHGEGTKYPTTSMNENADGKLMRSIGTYAQNEDHIFEIRHNSDLPDNLATIQWLAMGPAEFSVYVPFFTGVMSEVPECYKTSSAKEFDSDSIYWIFNELGNIGNGKYFRKDENGVYLDRTGTPIDREKAESVLKYLDELNITDDLHSYFDDIQNQMNKDFTEINESMISSITDDSSPEEITDLANEYANDVAEYAYLAGLAKLAEIDNKIEKFTGDEIVDVIKPDKSEDSASGDASGDASGSGNHETTIMIIGFIIALLCGAGIFFLTRSANKKEAEEKAKLEAEKNKK